MIIRKQHIYFHHTKHISKKLSFIWLPWLLARLWLSFDPSRLVMPYLRPKPAIERIAKYILRLCPASWIISGKQQYCIKISENNHWCDIRQLPTIELNWFPVLLMLLVILREFIERTRTLDDIPTKYSQ